MNPWEYATDVYFEAGQRVVITDLAGAEGKLGTIAGLAFDHVIKTYIVILDEPLATEWLPVKRALAIVVPNGYLRPVIPTGHAINILMKPDQALQTDQCGTIMYKGNEAYHCSLPRFHWKK